MMDFSLGALLQEARLTLRDPRDGARRVMALDLPMSARWIALLLTAIGSTILTHFSLGMLPDGERDALVDILQSPFLTLIAQAGFLLLFVCLIFWVGRARGGTGTFAETLALMTWLQLLMLGLQVAELLLQVVFPPLAATANLIGFAAFLWLLTNFVAELHGFRSLVAVFGGLVLGIVVLGFALSVVLMIGMGGPSGI